MEIGPLQVPRVGHDYMPFSVKAGKVRLLKAAAAWAVLQVILECLGEVQLLGNLSVVAQQGLQLRSELITDHNGRGDLRLWVLAVYFRVAQHITQQKIAGLLVAMQELKEVPPARVGPALAQLVNNGSLNGDEVGLALSLWHICLYPV